MMLRILGHWKLKEETLGRTLWRIRFGRVYGPVERQAALYADLVTNLLEQMRIVDVNCGL